MKREIRLPLTLLITVLVIVIGAGLSSYAKRAPKIKARDTKTTDTKVTTHSFRSLAAAVRQSKSVEAARLALEKARADEASDPGKDATRATAAALRAYKEAVDAVPPKSVNS